MYTGHHVRYPLFLSDFNDTSIFSKDLRKFHKYKISRKSVQWEPSSSMRTDVMKLIMTFRNFANTPKNVALSFCEHITLGADRWNTTLVLKSNLLTGVEQMSPGTTHLLLHNQRQVTFCTPKVPICQLCTKKKVGCKTNTEFLLG